MADDELLIERLLRVIDEGRRTATYKLALLLALIDAVAVSPGETELPTRLVAERVLAIYYPQTRLYVAFGGIERELRQISMKTSPVLREALRLRLLGDNAHCRSADDVARALPDEYARGIGIIEDTFVRYPIPLMQVVGAAAVPFLYSVDWPQGTGVRALRRDGCDKIRLLDGVADRLAVLGPMLRPLIQLHWTRDVARWSAVAVEDDALQAHLFGTERIAFPRALASDLMELQRGCCFYCGDRLRGRVEVDHFLAWSRWPNDAIENLVVADRCNGAKSDHLAASGHLSRWIGRLDGQSTDLGAIAETRGWRSDAPRSLALVRTTYQHVSAGTPLWRRAQEFDFATGPITP